MKAILTACWVAFAVLVCGCLYDDLNVHYKQCGPDHPCPDDFICVERPVSLTESEGHCYTPADAPLCEAQHFCNLSRNWVEACRADDFSSTVEEDCDDSDLQCNPDTAQCASSCESEADCATNTCDTGTGLCRPMPACTDSTCADGWFCFEDTICVPSPTEDAITASSAPDLANCQPSSLGNGPDFCDLTGRVNFFPLSETASTIGLKVTLRPAGDPGSVIQEDIVAANDVDQGNGHYRFEQIATNQVYDVEVEARDVPGTDDSTVTTIHAGISIRADRVLDGLFSRGLAAMRVSDFDVYGLNLFPGIEDHRSLVIGRVTDCRSITPLSLGNATVGLAIPPVAPGRVYFFADSVAALVPDATGGLKATTTKGYYGAAGVPACRNQVGFSAREGSSVFPLGSVSFVAKPGAAVIANMPSPADRLPD